MSKFDMEIPMVTFEPGHRVIKIGATDCEHVAHFDHDVIEIDSARYEYLRSRENGDARYDVVSVGGLFYIVGERAYNEKSGQVETRRNLRKYEQPYITALLVSGLLRLYNGNIPPRINIMIAHAPLLYESVSTIRRSVLGTTRYSYIGGKGQFLVEYSEPYDEVVAGCMNILLNPYGQPYARETFDMDVTSGRWLFYDLGGGTLDLGQLRDGIPVYDNIESHDVGGNDAINTFCALVSKNHRKLVAGTKDQKFPREIAYEVLMTPDMALEHFGTIYTFKDEFDEAFSPLVRSSQRLVADYTNGWLGYKGVIAIGGVCGVLYNQLEDMVFAGFKGDTKGKKPRIKPVEDNLAEMVFGNIRGAGRWARAKLGTTKQPVKPIRRK